MTEKRPQGRPFGSRDSYKRTRSCKVRPPTPALKTIMPHIHELVDNARQMGYHMGVGRPQPTAKEAVDKSITQLLVAIQKAMKNETN